LALYYQKQVKYVSASLYAKSITVPKINLLLISAFYTFVIYQKMIFL